MDYEVLKRLGIDKYLEEGMFANLYIGKDFYFSDGIGNNSYSPIDGSELSSYSYTSKGGLGKAMKKLEKAFHSFKTIPAPRRGELVRVIGNLAREYKEDLAYLITLESGKIKQEALGEVQEFIDMCDFAVGLSRQLYGLSISSERFRHKMIEQWHPLGVVGVVTAFNFPMAVWAWNAMISLVCGNSVLWKPSNQTPLCAIACHGLIIKALEEFDDIPKDISSVILSARDITKEIAKDKRIKLLSATGSIAMGKKLAPLVSKRLGRVLLELGGNNAMVVCKSADLELTTRAIVFSAVGTAGQRCTSLRRVFVHKSIVYKVIENIKNAYKSIKIGNPFEDGVLMGPLVNKESYEKMQNVLDDISYTRNKILYGGERVEDEGLREGYYVTPAIVKMYEESKYLKEETFAPILYIIEFENLEEAIRMHNDVPQGLSSAIFTKDLKEAEIFMSSIGSDCGMANVNIGTSGAEIGGAFGGEKDTGGGRESGSDAWKNYMRRATNTINYSNDIPLAQGIIFNIKE